MKTEFKLDTREFNEALSQYQKVTTKSVPEILNKVAKDVALRAAQATPKSSEGKIKRDLFKNVGGSTLKIYKIVNAARRNRGVKPVWGHVMGEIAQWHLAKRIKSIAFLRAGWAEAATDLGHTYRGRAGQKRRNLGKGIKATPSTLAAWLYYYIPGKQFNRSGDKIMSIAKTALQRGFDVKAQDMIKRINQVYAQRAAQYSAK